MNKTLALSLLSAALAAQAYAESLMLPPMTGFTQVHEQQQGAHGIREWVLQGESTQQWTTMITVNMAPPASVTDFREQLGAMWVQSCPQGSAVAIREGEENGYPFVFFMLSCPNNPATQLPEYTWVKALGGRETLYVAQYAFRRVAEEKDVVTASQWLRDVHVRPD